MIIWIGVFVLVGCLVIALVRVGVARSAAHRTVHGRWWRRWRVACIGPAIILVVERVAGRNVFTNVRWLRVAVRRLGVIRIAVHCGLA